MDLEVEFSGLPNWPGWDYIKEHNVTDIWPAGN